MLQYVGDYPHTTIHIGCMQIRYERIWPNSFTVLQKRTRMPNLIKMMIQVGAWKPIQEVTTNRSA